MRSVKTKAERRANDVRDAKLGLAILGIIHFIGSLAIWGFFYVGAYRNHWQNALTVGYGLRHLSPAIVLLALFAWTLIATFRRRRYSSWLLLCSLVLALGTFTLEARGEPQFQRVWMDDPMTCTNRQSYYCTWWWWQPTRH